jgi:type II secretory pathway pseudopilin PulG
MATGKIKSFTLSELLIVMIITAIVVGMAFSVLRLVQKQIHTIQKNFDKTTALALFEQRMWQDFNTAATIDLTSGNLLLQSPKDTVSYKFTEDYIMRNADTIPLKLRIVKTFFTGREIKYGNIDAISISGEAELPDYTIFVSKRNDVTFFMNQDGF